MDRHLWSTYNSAVEQYFALVQAFGAGGKILQKLVGLIDLLWRVGVVQLLAQFLQLQNLLRR